MTQEEKSKAYDIALDKIKRLLGTGSNCSREDLEYVFPELAESEDERIRKALVELVHDTTGDSLWVDYGIHKEDALAWLEKQCSQIPANSAKTCKDEQKPINSQFTPEQASILDKHIDKSLEQKPVDETEPKFKAEKGKWYVCIKDLLDNYANKVFRKGDIYLSTQDGSLIPSNSNVPYEVTCFDTYFRDWTIQDAKDGDVLLTKECEEPKIVFILKGNVPKNCVCGYYCYYNIMYPHFATDKEEGCLAPECKDLIPATKEQRDTLEMAMTNAGYRWDKEKLKLEKI